MPSVVLTFYIRYAEIWISSNSCNSVDNRSVLFTHCRCLVIRPGSEISLGIEVIIRVRATCSNNKSKMKDRSAFFEEIQCFQANKPTVLSFLVETWSISTTSEFFFYGEHYIFKTNKGSLFACMLHEETVKSMEPFDCTIKFFIVDI